MAGIPYEISESAKIDGAGEIRIYAQLYLPVAKPLLATLDLFAALGYWNDWYNSMLFSTKEEMQSLQYFLQDMLSTIQALKQLVAEGQFELVENISMPSTSCLLYTSRSFFIEFHSLRYRLLRLSCMQNIDWFR